jgi:hypothetical protein
MILSQICGVGKGGQLQRALTRNITLRAPTPECPEQFYPSQKGSLPMLKSVVVANPRSK